LLAKNGKTDKVVCTTVYCMSESEGFYTHTLSTNRNSGTTTQI